MERRYSWGVSSLGRPCLSSLPSATSCFFLSAMGPRPHLRHQAARGAQQAAWSTAAGSSLSSWGCCSSPHAPKAA